MMVFRMETYGTHWYQGWLINIISGGRHIIIWWSPLKIIWRPPLKKNHDLNLKVIWLPPLKRIWRLPVKVTWLPPLQVIWRPPLKVIRRRPVKVIWLPPVKVIWRQPLKVIWRPPLKVFRNLKISGGRQIILSRRPSDNFKLRKTFIYVIYISQYLPYTCMCIQFLALLCATAQQSYCRHSGVRRVLRFR